MGVRCHSFLLPESRAPMMRSFSLPKKIILGLKWSDSTEGTWQRFFSLAWVDVIVLLWCHNFPRLGFSSGLQKNDGTRDSRQFVFKCPGLLILSRTHSSESSMTSCPSSLMTECLRLFRCGLGFYLPWVDFFKGLWWGVPPLNNIAFWRPSQNSRVDQEGNVNQLDWLRLCLFQDWLPAHADLEPQLSGLSKWSVLEQAEWFFWPFVPQWIFVYCGNIVFLSLLYTSRVTIGCSTPSSTWVQVWHSCEIRAGIGLSMASRCTFLFVLRVVTNDLFLLLLCNCIYTV